MAYQVQLPDGSLAWIDDSVPQNKALDLAKQAYPDAFPPPPSIGRQIVGLPGEIAKGFIRGLTVDPISGALSTAYTGAQAAGAELTPFEQTAVGKGLGAAQTALAPGEGMISQFGGGLGSLLSYLPAGLIKGGVGLATRLTQAGAGGAEEARSRAEQARLGGEAYATPGEQFISQVLGTGVGFTELAPIERLARPLQAVMRGVPKSEAEKIAPGLLNSARRMLETGGIEGLQEGMANVAQDLIAKGIYNPNLDVGDSALGDAAMGASIGAFAQGAIELATRGKRGRVYESLKAQEREADERKKVKELEDQKQKEIAQTKENLGIKDTTTLALPAPAVQVEEEQKTDPLMNPVGFFNANELTPEYLKAVNNIRDKEGKAKLKEFSIEDVADAGAPQAEVDRLLTYKSGYDGSLEIKQNDVLDMATSKNVDTNTVGFKDFLRRTTGSENLQKMSAPQLYSAWKALDALAPSETLRILPEGTNATRFTQEQYDRSIKNLTALFPKTNLLGRSEVVKEIKDYSGLESDRDAESLLQTAIRKGDLTTVSKPRYDVVDKSGKTVRTYLTRDSAERAATKENLSVREGSSVDVALPGTTAELPGGPDIRRGTFKQGVEPAGYEILSPDAVLGVSKTQDEADAKADRLAKLRQNKANGFLGQTTSIESQIAKSNAKLEDMEAEGKGDTPEYKKMAANIAANNKKLQAQADRFKAQANSYSQPLTVAPKGEKPTTREGYTLFENSNPVATFPTQQKAEEAAITRLNDMDLQKVASLGRFQKGLMPKRLAAMAKAEMDRRAGKAPEGIEVAFTGTREEAEAKLAQAGIFTGEIRAKVDELEKKLKPVLEKLGLKDVGLRITKAIRAGESAGDGEYAARLITIALNATDPMGTLRHEGLHALKELGAFTDAEWKVLTKKAREEWIDRFLKSKQVLDQNGKPTGVNAFDEYMRIYDGDISIVEEEAIAEAFRYFSTQAKKPAGMVGNVLMRVGKFFNALGNALRGMGFQTADDIFTRIEAGEMTRRAEVAPGAGPRLSLPVEDMTEGKFYRVGIEKGGAKKSFIGKLTKISPQKNLYQFEEYNKEGDMRDRIQIVQKDFIKAVTPLEQDLMYGGFKSASPGEVSKKFSLATISDEEFFAREREKPRKKRVVFEVAPDPTDEDLVTRWRSLTPEQRLNISDRVSRQVVQDTLDAMGLSGRTTAQVGSYLDDTNPSFALFLDSGDSVEVAKMLGFVLSQDSMMVISPKPAKGLDEVQSIAINLGDMSPEQVDGIYRSLREIRLNDEQPVGGQSYMNGRMVILNYSNTPTPELAQAIEQKLNGQYNISVGPVYSAFPDKGAYNYADPSDDPRGSRGDLRKRGRAIRAEASRAIERELKAAGFGRAPSVSTGVNILDGRVDKPDFGKKPTVDEVGRYFDGLYEEPLSYTNPTDFNRALQSATDEFNYQLKHEKSGLDWYEDDIKQAFKDTIKIIPDLRQGQKRALFNVMAGIMSPGVNARDNWFITAKAFQHYIGTNEIPSTNPETGGLWQGGVQSAIKKTQLDVLNAMVQDMGEAKAVEWLYSDHPVREINQVRRKYGVKSPIGGKMGEMKSGLYAFGPKVGPFVSNINGIHDVTVDKWMTRTFNRYFGTMIGPDGKIIDAPTEPQRRAAKQLINEVAKNVNVKPYQVQSVLWFFEQRLFRELGTTAPSYGFSDGATKFLESNRPGGIRGGEPGGADGTVTTEGGRRLQLRTTETPEFQDWFGNSAIRNNDGTPKVMYHGTAQDITTFKPKQANAIFLTESPRFAEGFSSASENYMIKKYMSSATPEQTSAIIEKAIEKGLINKDIRPSAVESLRLMNLTAASRTVGIGDYVRELVGNELSSLGNIMPLYVRAEIPFDFNNDSDVEDVMIYMKQKFDEGLIQEESINDGLFDSWDSLEKGIFNGDWQAIEHPFVQEAIQMNGHDGFYVIEGNQKNLAVYNPNQVKSAIGNIGTFAVNSNDIRYALALGSLEPSSALIPNEGGQPDGTLGLFPDRLNGKPIKMLIGTHNDLVPEVEQRAIRGRAKPLSYGANHILNRVMSNPERAPGGADELLERIVRTAQNTAQKYSRIYKDGKNFVLYDGRNSLVVDPQADQNSIITMYVQDNPEKRYGNPVWVGRAPLVPQTLAAVRGYDVVADEEGRVIAKPPEKIAKKQRVYTPDTITEVVPVKTGTLGAKQNRFSLSLSTDIKGAIDRTTTARDDKGYVQRVLQSISPQSRTAFRQGYIFKHASVEKLGERVAEKFGNQELLADVSSLAAVLFSERAAGVAASSFKNGIPVYLKKKGFTTVTDKNAAGEAVKGLIPILQPIAEIGDPYAWRAFQFYAATRRGKRLIEEVDPKTGQVGLREKLITKEDVERGNLLEKQFPVFKQVFNEYQKYNAGLVQFMKDTGVISEKEAQLWTENWDYIPFYRQLEGDDSVVTGPKIFSSISGVAKPKKLKGSEEKLGDFMETVVRNSRAAIEAGMKNVAAQRIIRDVLRLNEGEFVPASQARGTDIVTVKENGITKHYRVNDPLLVESMKSLHLPQLPFLDILSKPAEVLRNLVTKDPGFMMANLMRDSLQAWVTTGANITPLVDTFKQYGATLAGMSPEARALSVAGLFTGYDFSGDVQSTAKHIEKELRSRTKQRTTTEKVSRLTGIPQIWDLLDKGSTASDVATRAAVYKDVLAKTGNEAEALFQAMEVLNFSRKGNSALIQVLTATIPFLNARIQGLDVLYRAAMGKMPMANREAMKKTALIRSLYIIALSSMYAVLASDQEEYKTAEQETRDNNWIIGSVKIPIPFELGVLFKVIPERIYQYSFGTDTTKDLRDAFVRNVGSTLSTNFFIPQAVLPLLEATANYSMFTGNPIVGQGMESVSKPFQAGPSTSLLAQEVGKTTGQSPMVIDSLIRGYTGTLGTYAVMAIDAVMRGEGDPTKATMKAEQLPVIKRFFASPTSTGTVSSYYDLKNQVDEATRTINFLERSGNSEDLRAYYQEKGAKLAAVKPYIQELDRNMKTLREMRQAVLISKIDSDQKREILDNIRKSEVAMTSRVQFLKKQLD